MVFHISKLPHKTTTPSSYALEGYQLSVMDYMQEEKYKYQYCNGPCPTLERFLTQRLKSKLLIMLLASPSTLRY